MFRLLGFPPGADISVHAAASLAGVPVGQASQLLRELGRAHLVTEHAPGRYAFHDLLRAYAARQCQGLDSEQDRRAALTRLFDYYLAAAGTAMHKLMPVERERWPPIPSSAVPLLPPLGTTHAARAWLDAERATLVAVAGYTAARGWPGHTTRLSVVLYRYYLDIGAHYSDGLAVHTHALHAARQSGDRGGQADALSSRGAVYLGQGRYPQAARQFRQALAIYEQLGDRRGQARVLNNLGYVLWDQARYQESADHCRRALALHRAVGDQFGQAIALNNLGDMLCRLGRYEQAAVMTGRRWPSSARSVIRTAKPARWPTWARCCTGKASTRRLLATSSGPWPCSAASVTETVKQTSSMTSAPPCAGRASTARQWPGTGRH